MSTASNIPAVLLPATLLREITVTEITPELSSMYPIIGCDIVERVALAPAYHAAIWVDEEGLLKANPTNNLTACDLLAEITNSAPAYLLGGGLAGTCSLVSDDDLRGLTADEVAKITKALDNGGYPYGNSTFNALGIEVNVIRAY